MDPSANVSSRTPGAISRPGIGSGFGAGGGAGAGAACEGMGAFGAIWGVAIGTEGTTAATVTGFSGIFSIAFSAGASFVAGAALSGAFTTGSGALAAGSAVGDSAVLASGFAATARAGASALAVRVGFTSASSRFLGNG